LGQPGRSPRKPPPPGPKLNPDHNWAFPHPSPNAAGQPGWVGDVPRMEAVVGAGDLLYVPCQLIHNVHTVRESITLSYALVDHRAATCARHLNAAGSHTFGATFQRIRDGGLQAAGCSDTGNWQNDKREIFAPEDIVLHDYSSAPPFAPVVDAGLSWPDFTRRYCMRSEPELPPCSRGVSGPGHPHTGQVQ
jgi:hypothetical protein